MYFSGITKYSVHVTYGWFSSGGVGWRWDALPEENQVTA